MTETTTDQRSTTELVDTYLEAWRATDDVARQELVRTVFVPQGRHVDPLADATGYEELCAVLASVHGHYPGFAIERTTGVDQHRDQLRFGWRLDAADGTTVVSGVDVAELAPDGRLARVAGFWGELPPR